MKQLLAIRNVAIEHAGLFEEVLRQKNYQISYIDAFKGQLAGNLKNYSLILVLGGYMGAYEEDKFPFLKHEYKVIEEALTLNIPLIGICLGSQMLARVLGARVYKGHTKEIGFFDIHKVSNHEYFYNFPDKFKAFQWHNDTFDLPNNTQRVFSSSSYKNQGFVYKNAIGLQFHIEVSLDMIKKWLLEYKEEVEKENLNTQDILDNAKVYTLTLKKYIEYLINNIENGAL
ncbi:type 1 glutamine amidotransferase [Desulfurella sp.]|uniref:type 1 glutamine amidotransferase n=1 Tax=Desulfurella sp. TaxID=1962857 RepID=UPI0025B899C4|nr:gamma-glutamyl-gamma-aminobutyrate hydrolase family protein [Desulfurella sp.]